MTYEIKHSPQPPNIIEREGKYYVEIIDGETFIRAEVTAYFAERVMEVYVIPQIRKIED